MFNSATSSQNTLSKTEQQIFRTFWGGGEVDTTADPGGLSVLSTSLERPPHTPAKPRLERRVAGGGEEEAHGQPSYYYCFKNWVPYIYTHTHTSALSSPFPIPGLHSPHLCGATTQSGEGGCWGLQSNPTRPGVPARLCSLAEVHSLIGLLVWCWMELHKKPRTRSLSERKTPRAGASSSSFSGALYNSPSSAAFLSRSRALNTLNLSFLAWMGKGKARARTHTQMHTHALTDGAREVGEGAKRPLGF